MIRLFVTDIDGCLADPYTPYDLEALSRLRQYGQSAGELGTGDARPALTVCSGRPYPYVEAITQALDLSVPVLFEAGGGCFDPVTAQTTWSPALSDEMEANVKTIEDWFKTECIPGTSLSLDYAKRTQAGVVSPDPDEIVAVRQRTEAFVAENALDLHVFSTDISVDVIPPGITKVHGLKWLSDELGVRLDEMAYIGDSNGDLEALDAVGISFAPANAVTEVRETVDYVTEGRVLDGTLEAYRTCLQLNET